MQLSIPTVLVLGAIAGSVYSVLGLGIVAMYKATRVPNFAFGTTATFVALFHYEAVAGHTYAVHWNLLLFHLNASHRFHPDFWVMMPVSLALAAAIGYLIERFVMRPFAEAPTITLIIVSVGLYLILTGLAGEFFGLDDRFVTGADAPFSRAHTVRLLGVYLTYERLGILILSLLVSGAVFALFRWTRTGLAIRALSTKRDVAQLCGVSARRLSVLSWVTGTVLAGFIGILLSAEQVDLNTTNLTLTAVVGFIAAVIGGMTSLPIAFGAGLGLGVLQELVQAYYPSSGIEFLGHNWTQTGMPESASILVALVVLVAKPKWIFAGTREDEDSGVTMKPLSQPPLLARALDPIQAWRLWRSALGMDWTSLDETRRRRTRQGLIVAVLAVVLGWPLLGVNHDVYGLDFTIALAYFMLSLSIVVLTGWAGQISLAQGAFVAVGGVGALIGADGFGLPFPLPILCAMALSVPFSLLVGLPALRLRGLYLAIATLGFGYGASRLVAGNVSLGASNAPTVDLFGWHASTTLETYYALAAVVGLVTLLCWRVSVTRPGRAFYAVRDSEIVASAYGINTTRTKLVGFVLAGAVASVAGAILTYVIGQPGSGYTDIFFSITWLAYVVVAGIASISGALLAAAIFGLLPLVFTAQASASSTGTGAEVVAGILLVLVMMINPGGLATMTRFVRRRATVHSEDPDPITPELLIPAAIPANGVAVASVGR